MVIFLHASSAFIVVIIPTALPSNRLQSTMYIIINRSLTKLKEACPLINEQGRGTHTNADGVGRTMLLFVSDRDKRLKPALRDVFPRNCKTSCAKHIEANISQIYGKLCGQYNVAVAKSFSTRYSIAELLDNIRAMKEVAATYLEGITMRGILWQSTLWLNVDPCLPPCYGIVTRLKYK
jgi:hypothetical protein